MCILWSFVVVSLGNTVSCIGVSCHVILAGKLWVGVYCVGCGMVTMVAIVKVAACERVDDVVMMFVIVGCSS